jgi:hypothetical protein
LFNRLCYQQLLTLEITVFSNLSGDLRSKSQRKVYLQIELKSTTYYITCVIINCNNFRARILNQIHILLQEKHWVDLAASPLTARYSRSIATCGQVRTKTNESHEITHDQTLHVYKCPHVHGTVNGHISGAHYNNIFNSFTKFRTITFHYKNYNESH